jgi:hypothetical protein
VIQRISGDARELLYHQFTCCRSGAEIVMVQLPAAVLLAESWTSPVNENDPVRFGVPVIAPVELSRDRPGGNEPDDIEKVV